MNNSINGNASNYTPKKRFLRFNFVDFILIVIILLFVATLIYIFAPFSHIKELTSDKNLIVEYTVEVIGVDEEFINKIKENDIVINSVSKNNMGTVTAVDYNTKSSELQLQYNVEKNSYEGILVEYPNKYNVIITITANAKYLEESGYYVNDCRIAVGENMSLRFPDYICEGYCIGLDPS